MNKKLIIRENRLDCNGGLAVEREKQLYFRKGKN